MFSGMPWHRKVLILLVLSFALYLPPTPALADLLPASAITDPADGTALPASLGSYSIRGVASDSGSGLNKVEVSIDGGSSWEAAYDTSGNGSLNAWEYAWSPLPLGSYSIMSRATDNLGGVEYPGPGTHVIIDGSPPASAVTSPASGSYIAGATCVITGVADDGSGSGVASVAVSTDGGTTWNTASGTSSWSFSWTVPTDGTYAIISRATDAATNVESPYSGVWVIVDNTLPSSTVTSPADGEYVGGSVYTVTGTADDGVGSGIASVEVSTDGGASWSTASGSSSWSFSWTVPTDGSYTLLSRAKDTAANVETAGAGVAVTVDNSSPTSTVTDPVDGSAVNSDFYDIAGVATDGAGSGVVKVDVSTDGGQTWDSASDTSGDGSLSSWTYHWSPLPLGNRSITVRATDGAGNVETPAAGVHLLVDRTPPLSSIAAPVEGEYIGGTAYYAVTGTAADTGGAGIQLVEVSIDGGAWQQASGTGNWSYSWEVPADGSHSITVRARDAAGNTETPGTGVSVTVDKTAPASQVTDPVDGTAVNTNSYDISGIADDGAGSGVVNVDVSMDGGQTWNSASDTSGNGSLSSWTYNCMPLPLGNHSITVRATDGAGNVGVPASGVHLIVDRTAPVSTLGFPSDGAVLTGLSCTVTGTASDDGGAGVDRVDVSTDGGATWSAAEGAGAWSYSWTIASDGGYTIMSRAVDRAGNVETPAAGVSVTVDNTPPSSLITSPAPGGYLSGSLYTVTGTADDGSGAGVQTVEVSIDGGPWQPAVGTDSWSYAWTLPSDGSFTVRSRSVDAAGNVETPGAGITVNVDNTPPSSSITSPTEGAYVGGSVYTITGTANDGTGSGVQGVEVSTDGGASWSAASGTGSWSFSWSVPTDGTYNIKSRAVDAASNVETPGSGVTVTVDATPPVSSVTYPSDGALLGGSSICTITGTASDGSGSGVQGVEVSTDGGATWHAASGADSWSYSWTLAADGTYSVRSRATDIAGNEETPGAGVSVTVDTTPPSSAITAPAAGALVGGTISYTVAGTSDDGSGSGVMSVEVSTDGGSTWNAAAGTASWSYTWTLPTDGNYTIMSRAADNAGNTETPGPGVAVTVDTTPPTGSIELKSGRYTKARTVHLTLSARDAGSSCPEPDPVMCEIDMMQLSDDGINWLAWEIPSTDISWRFTKGDGEKSVFVHYRDLAGNVSEDYVATAIVDTVNPVSAVTSPADGSVIVLPVTTISGTSVDSGSGVALVEVSTDGGVSWAAATDTASWTYQWSPSSDGSYNILSRATDNAGNVEIPGPGVTVTVSLDTTAPTGSVSINSGAQYTNSTDAVLTLTAGDSGSGVSDMRISTDGTLDTEPWEPYASSKGLTLLPGDGVKDVYVSYRDAAGNESVIYTAEITLDTVPPVGSVVIDGGSEVTNTADVTLGIDASDTLSGVVQMQVSADGLFLTEPWEPYATNRVWSLSPADGPKTVYVRFMDAASNVSEPASDGINLSSDIGYPSSIITDPSDGANIAGAGYKVTGTAFDNISGSGVALVEISTNGGASWQAATGTTTWSFDWAVGSPGSHNIRSRATDVAGNVETPGAGITVTVAAIGSPELVHFDWDAWLESGDCGVCHKTPATFMEAGFREGPGFCRSCHNAAAPAHDRNLMGTREHTLFGSVTTTGCRMPTYGNITSAEYDNRMYANLMDSDKVVCVTCHNPMRKTEDMGRVWEYTTTSDELTYELQNGGWDGYGNLAPIVYRDTNLWAGPSYVKDRKAYQVSPSEYTFDEYSGTLTFIQAQDPSMYIYVTLDYPYLRVSNAANTMCTDCHAEETHMGVNCLTCHAAHNTDNLGGMREVVRTTDRSERAVSFINTTGANSFADGDGTYDGICEVCHTQTLYHKRDGSGAAHRGGEDCGSCHTHASGFAR